MFFSKKKSEQLLALIRNGSIMSGNDKIRLLLSLSIPSMLAQLSAVVMFFIDQAMVGSLGARASAAIGIVETTTWLMGGITSATSMGFSVQVAHFIGANDFARAREVIRTGLVTATLFSLIVMLGGICIATPLPFWLGGGTDIAHDASMYFLIFSFALPFFQLYSLSAAVLKCAGDMQLPSVMSIAMCLLDVVFNFLLIYPCREMEIFGWKIFMPGAGLGVTGAAIGTALSIVVATLFLSGNALFRSPTLSILLDKTRRFFVWSYFKQALKISTPMGLQVFLMGSAHVVSTMIVTPLGNIAIAANTLAITAESLCYMPGYGIGEAATTLVGQSLGAGRKDLCRSFARISVFTGMIVMAFMGLVMYIAAYDMMSLMTPVEEIRTLGAACLRIEAFAEPMFAASIVTYSVCVGAGDTLRPAIYNLISMWGIRLSLAALLAKDYGLRGVWIAMAVELTMRGLIFMVRLYRGKWMKAMQVNPKGLS